MNEEQIRKEFNKWLQMNGNPYVSLNQQSSVLDDNFTSKMLRDIADFMDKLTEFHERRTKISL